MTYHLHTELKPNLPTLVSSYFPSFTLLPGTGYWQGGSEPTCVIEITTSDSDGIKRLAQAIRSANAQEAVLVESTSTDSYLVTADTARQDWLSDCDSGWVPCPDQPPANGYLT